MSNTTEPMKGESWTHKHTEVTIEIVDVTGDCVRVTYPSGMEKELSREDLLSTYNMYGEDTEEVVVVSNKDKIALPLEVFNDEPIDHERAWKELKRTCHN